MATRSRRSAAAEVVEEVEEQGGLVKLQFNQPLVGRPGKPVSIGDLLTRLKKLCEELRGLEQDEADRSSLEPYAKELAHSNLLSHKDSGVRAWTACCVVDMFRLCAPDAPYTASQLKDIFTLIVNKIFPLLADPSNPYNGQHLYILKSLAEVKSIVLLTDIPGSGDLIQRLFSTCFDVLSGPSKADSGEELSKNVEHHMTAVLSILVDEAQNIGSEVTDVILAQFLRADPTTMGAGSTKGRKSVQVDAKQSTLLLKDAPPAYNMAKNICNACPEKMARHIGSYFSSVIVDITAGGSRKPQSRNRVDSDIDDSDDEGQKGPSDEDFKEASKAHRLLRELWRCCPGVLQEIIPHLQEELGTENVQLRQLATETFGDMIAGVGAAGPPPPPNLDPVAYPSQSMAPTSENIRTYNFLTTPTSPNSFPSQHPAPYHAFLQRQKDKSPIIRASWTTAIGRILVTSAGGVGLDSDEEKRLLESFAACLIDSDDRVRLAAVRAIEQFEFDDIVQKIGNNGAVSEPGSILSNLADRVKDKKSTVHTESIKLLGRIWGVASGAIADGNERITSILGPIPSRIFEACYVNDPEINLQIDLTTVDSLLPLNYPPMKAKQAVNGGSQVVKDSQTNGEHGFTEGELDKLRAERQLVLVNGLEEKGKKAFFAKQGNQAAGSQYMNAFLTRCEQYNGGVIEKDEKSIKQNLTTLIGYYARTLPETSRAVDDLWKFVKAHDRRSYQLIRFCMAPESDYRKVFRSIKELRKRIEDSPSSPTLSDTLLPLVYRVSLLYYNKSHVPAIIQYSRNDEKGLGATAHEVLKEISTKHPKVFATHVQELCKALESEAPTAKKSNGPGALDDLKACSGFARKFPKDLPTDRKFIQSMISFALYGSPPKTAKHAVTIIMSSATKKEMHAKDVLKKSTQDFEYGGDHYVTKLAALSQLVLLGHQECESFNDAIVNIAINHVFLRAHEVSPGADSEWMDVMDDDMAARVWALKLLVNRVRAHSESDDLEDIRPFIFTLLNKLVKENGEGSKKKDTPLAHKNFQRLLAANLFLKLARIRRLDSHISPTQFNQLAIVAQDPCLQIRKGFVTKLLKYLGQNSLAPRYYTILFLLAFEPSSALKDSVITWIRSRRAHFASRKETVLENVFARLLSLIAHHPDFDTEPDTLKLMAQYILFYLKAVATPDNISLIYHVAQRVKGVADGIARTAEADKNLYVLSDLSQAIIRLWEEQNGWSLQSWPGKLKLPAGIFRTLDSHDRAQKIADKVWINEEIVEELEPIVRSAMRSKKRKAHDGEDKTRKKVKMEKTEKSARSIKAARTPKKKRRGGDSDADDDGGASGRAHPSSEARRRSGRQSGAKSYVEVSEEEEDDVEAGAEEAESTEESEQEATSQPDEDVAMEDQEEEQPEPEPESDRELERSTKSSKFRGGKKTNGVAPSPQVKKKLTQLVKASPKRTSTPSKTTSRAKAKVNGNVSSSPTANGPVRRSTRRG